MIFRNKNASNHLKLLYISTLFVFTIVVESDLLFYFNEIKINSAKPISNLIKEHLEKENRTIIVYDRLLPSLSFYLNQPIITIYNGNYTAQRETYFETNQNWRKNLINYKNKDERDLLFSKFTNRNTFLIIRDNAIEPDSIKKFRKNLYHSKKVGKYLIYY